MSKQPLDFWGGTMKKLKECKWCGGLTYKIKILNEKVVKNVNVKTPICRYCLNSIMTPDSEFHSRPNDERYKIELHINRCFNQLENVTQEKTND